jgi:hypothetical protein
MHVDPFRLALAAVFCSMLTSARLRSHYTQGWPELYISTVYDRIFGDVSHYTQGWPELYINTAYDCIFGDFPAKNTVYTPWV